MFDNLGTLVRGGGWAQVGGLIGVFYHGTDTNLTWHFPIPTDSCDLVERGRTEKALVGWLRLYEVLRRTSRTRVNWQDIGAAKRESARNQAACIAGLVRVELPVDVP